MQSKLLAVALLSSALAGCLGTGQSGPNPYLRVDDHSDTMTFVGVRFTPDTDATLRVYDAPVACGTSFCPSGSWEPIGVLRSGPVGAVWPSVEGQFNKSMNRHDMAVRRQVTVTCKPGETWKMDFSVTDTATNRTAAHYDAADTALFFWGVPRCA